MNYITNRGKYDAIVQDSNVCLQCSGAKNCLAVCPSYNVNYEELAKSSKNDFLGKIENVYNGYSNNNNTRLNSSSGGFIRELATELLNKKEIDGVISIVHDSGLNYTPKIITDISKMPNSIYHNINYENAIELLKNNVGKYLLIGLPCQITSIEQLLNKKKFSYLKDRIYTKVALICGYTFERTNMEFFAKLNDFDMQEMNYREKGRYRKTRMSNKSNSILFDVYNPSTIQERINNSVMFDKWMPQKHCLYCVDHIGYCADIVVGDAWQSRYENDEIGTNIIISRTPSGDNIIKNLDTILLEDGNISEIEESQHLYSKPHLGLSIAKENFFKDDFIVNHLVSKDDLNFKPIIFTNKDKFKIVYLKMMLRKRYFRLVKYLYILTEFKLVVKLIIKKIIGKKI